MVFLALHVDGGHHRQNNHPRQSRTSINIPLRDEEHKVLSTMRQTNPWQNPPNGKINGYKLLGTNPSLKASVEISTAVLSHHKNKRFAARRSNLIVRRLYYDTNEKRTMTLTNNGNIHVPFVDDGMAKTSIRL